MINPTIKSISKYIHNCQYFELTTCYIQNVARKLHSPNLRFDKFRAVSLIWELYGVSYTLK